MMTTWKLGNNVRHTLNAAISAVDVSVTLNVATSPYRTVEAPVSASADSRGVITLQDSLTNPTKIEVITFSGWIDNGNGTITLTGLLRGQESTVASAFSIGHYAFQTLTTAGLNSPLMTLKHDAGNVTFNGGGEPDVPAVIVKSGGLRAETSDEFNGQVIDIAAPTHNNSQGYFRMAASLDGVAFYAPHIADPSFFSNTYDSVFLEVNWNLYPPAFDKHVVLIKNLSVRRLEQVKAIRHDVDGEGALANNVSIDWSAHDIRRMSLSANANVTMSDTSQFYPNDGRYRRLTFMIEIGGVNAGYAVTWSSNVKWPNGAAAPLFNTGINQIRVIEFLYDGNYFLAESMRTYQL